LELLKSKLAEFKAFWARLSERERYLLVGCGAVLAILILYWGIWVPYRSTREELERTLPQVRQQVTVMHIQEEKVRQLKEQKLIVTIPADKMKDAVETSLANVDLLSYVQNIKDDGAGNITLSAEEIPFSRWITWSAQIVKELGISIVSVKMTQKGEGVVQLEATLSSLAVGE